MSNSNVNLICAADYTVSSRLTCFAVSTRNKDPILVLISILERFINCKNDKIEHDSPFFVEISAGSSQHIEYFARNFPEVKFQPTEYYDKNVLDSISSNARSYQSKNILQPILIDIRNPLSHFGFLESSIDYIFNASIIDTSPYCEFTIGLFENAGKYLKPGAILITYGPYAKDSRITPQSTFDFDERNPLWGLKDINDLIKLADQNKLRLIDTVEMHSNNNLILIWTKTINNVVRYYLPHNFVETFYCI